MAGPRTGWTRSKGSVRRSAFPVNFTVSHPEKVLFPETGFTKADVIRYYWAVAPALLPHLRGRPITMVRWPEGVRGGHFFEKDAPPFTPSWVKLGLVPRNDPGEAPIRYVLVNDARTLLWVANLASLEIHPFLHRHPKIHCPTQVAFDLDPGDGAGLRECIEVAWLVRERLAALGLESWPKVSGSKGLQVYVPLNTPVTYAETTPFAQRLALELERDHPRLVVSNMAKALRRGRVLVDWSQNHEKKTTVAVYSLRARRAAPFVSAPVTWEELDRAHRRRDLDALRFTPAEAVRRVERLGDLFAPVLRRKQRLPRADRPAAPRRTRAAPGLPPEPRFVDPMLPLLAPRLPAGREWLYEVKWDGYRMEALKHGDSARLLSRRGKDFTRDFPEVAQAVARLPARSALLDGEVVALDEQGRPSFQRLQRRAAGKSPPVAYVFDLLELDGEDWRERPLEERKARLEALAAGTGLRLSASLPGKPERIAEQIRRLGLEGVVAKRRDSRYEPGRRSGAWVKFKLSPDQEFVIGGYNPGRPLESLIVGTYEGGRLLCAGKVRQGLNPRNRIELARRLEPLQTKRCPFADLPNSRRSHRGEGIAASQMENLVWVKPVTVAQIAFTEWTEGGNLRHGEYRGLREDKDAKEVVRETPAALPARFRSPRPTQPRP